MLSPLRYVEPQGFLAEPQVVPWFSAGVGMWGLSNGISVLYEQSSPRKGPLPVGTFRY